MSTPQRMIIVLERGGLLVYEADPRNVEPLYKVGEYVSVNLQFKGQIIGIETVQVDNAYYCTEYTIQTEYPFKRKIKRFESHLITGNPRKHQAMHDLLYPSDVPVSFNHVRAELRRRKQAQQGQPDAIPSEPVEGPFCAFTDYIQNNLNLSTLEESNDHEN